MNWDYDKEAYEKQAKADPVWALERAINYGTPGGAPLDKELLKKYLPQLNIQEKTRRFLNVLLWDKKL